MEIEQKIENVAGTQPIGEEEWPIATTREFQASIGVRSGETIVLGGLVENTQDNVMTKVPILGDIPLLGLPFRSTRKENVSNEVIVFITPYVLDTPMEIASESTRRRDAVAIDGLWQRGWSNSKLAQPADEDGEPKERDKKVRRLVRKERVARDRPSSLPGPSVAAPDALREVEATAEKGIAAEAKVAEKEPGPLSDLDPELVDFIRKQDKWWSRSLEKIDQRVEKEMRNP